MDRAKHVIHGDVQLDAIRKPKRAIIHVRGPGGRGIQAIILNGKPWEAFEGDKIIVPNPPERISIEVQYVGL